MHLFTSFLVLAAVLAVVSGAHLSGGTGHHSVLTVHRSGHRLRGCAYWCRTPSNIAYCCEFSVGPTRAPRRVHTQLHGHRSHQGHQSHHHHRTGSHHGIRPGKKLVRPSFGTLLGAGGHRGSCPSPHAFCPRIVHKASAPQLCKGDFSCGHAYKCCYDVCLKLKVCKLPHYG